MPAIGVDGSNEKPMRRASNHRIIVLLLCLAVAPLGWATPVTLSDACLVEGSLAHGGIQPDYLIWEGDPRLSAFLAKAQSIGQQPWDVAAKIRAVKDLVREALPETSYTNRAYTKLLENHRQANSPVPLGAYIEVGAGVCRENAMLTHLALGRAGIANQYYYAQVETQVRRAPAGRGAGLWGRFRNTVERLWRPTTSRVEDHAFVIPGDPRREPIVDSYNRLFDGRLLLDVQKGASAGPSSRVRVNEVLQFPRITALDPGTVRKVWRSAQRVKR